jgi:hypothetical protein
VTGDPTRNALATLLEVFSGIELLSTTTAPGSPVLEHGPDVTIQPEGRRRTKPWVPVQTRRPAGQCVVCTGTCWTFNPDAEPQHPGCDPGTWPPVPPPGPVPVLEQGPCTRCGAACRRYGDFGRVFCKPCCGEGEAEQLATSIPDLPPPRFVVCGEECCGCEPVMARMCARCGHAIGAHVGGRDSGRWGWAIYDRKWANASGNCSMEGCDCPMRRTTP